MATHYLAFDLGASSGRAILGTLSDGRIELEELHRFDNGPVDINGGLFWNLLGLFAELKQGLANALAKGVKISGIAIDTWGVDFGLIDGNGQFVGFPRHYRDPRTTDIYPYAFGKVPRDEMYRTTGIQFMNLNTVFQLVAMERDGDSSLQTGEKLLFMPNALTYLFSGNASAEYTIASTSQLCDANTGTWAKKMIEGLDLPMAILPDIVPPCTVVGELREAICEELKCDPVPFILVGSHDTASAVAAVPATTGKSWAYLSSGTWSLLGVELDKPLISDAGLAANYTNEGGVGGKIRFLKNIMGMWLIQESRSEWRRQGQNYTFDEMDMMAAEAEPFRSFIDPNDESFVAPGNLPERIAEFCRKTGQAVPETPGQIMRCALESLALRYRMALDEIEEITGQGIEILHLVGGGVKNLVLNQYTADAIGRPVITGPVEATALGNIAAQAMATGELADLAEARCVIAASTDTNTLLPADGAEWDEAYGRFRQLFA
ncbi:MAG: rhamnulokinase [Victivallales bacterium]|nr:rhamnulokinase [Victivallales bacterium]MBT7167117.1 rhamnulokinase [Victivallales bacterium]